MNEIRNIYEINFKYEYGHLSYNMVCPSCGEESGCLRLNYPETVTCPFCKTTFDLNILEKDKESCSVS